MVRILETIFNFKNLFIEFFRDGVSYVAQACLELVASNYSPASLPKVLGLQSWTTAQVWLIDLSVITEGKLVDLKEEEERPKLAR